MINDVAEVYSSKAWSSDFVRDAKLRAEVESMAAQHFGQPGSWKDVMTSLRWMCSPGVQPSVDANPAPDRELMLRVYAQFLSVFEPQTSSDADMVLKMLVKVSGLADEFDREFAKSLCWSLSAAVVRLHRQICVVLPKRDARADSILRVARQFAGAAWNDCIDDLAATKAAKAWRDVIEGNFSWRQRFELAAFCQPLRVSDHAKLFKRAKSMEALAALQAEVLRLGEASIDDLDRLACTGVQKPKKHWLLLTLLHGVQDGAAQPSASAASFWKVVEAVPASVLCTQAWLIGCALLARQGEWEAFGKKVASRHEIKGPGFLADRGAVRAIVEWIDEEIAASSDAGDQAGWFAAHAWVLQILKS